MPYKTVESFPINTEYNDIDNNISDEDAARGIIKELNTGIDR